MNHILRIGMTCAVGAAMALQAVAGFSPTDIGGLELWLKADEGVTNAVGATPSNGGTVAGWLDHSGNENHMTQATDGSRPAYRTSSLNRLPGVTGASGKFFTPASTIDAQSIFVVTVPPTGGTNPNIVFCRVDGTTPLDFFYRNGNAADSISFDGSVTPAPKGRYSIAGAPLSEFLAGHPVSTQMPQPLLLYGEYEDAQTFTQFMRRGIGSPNYYLIGDLCEVIVYDRALTEEEMNKVGYYLQSKYNIAGEYLPEEGVAYVEAGTVTEIGAGYVTISTAVTGITNGAPHTLRIYIGTTNGADNPIAWAMNEDLSASITGPTTNAYTTTLALAMGEKYYYRLSISDGTTENFAPASGTFITPVYGEPNNFTWINGASGDWVNAGAWEKELLYERNIPGVAGDNIATTNSATITLTDDKTVSGITIGAGLTLSYAVPVTLTFDSGDDAVTNLITMIPAAAATASFPSAAPDNDFVLNVVRNLRWRIGNGDSAFRFYVSGKISGGSDESPVSLSLYSSAGTYGSAQLVLLNPDNDFRGDMHLGVVGASNPLNLVLGHGSYPGYNSILGHPDNKVYLYSGALRVKSGDPDGFRRTVIGSGTIGGNQINGGYAGHNSDNLILGEGCSLEPMILPSNPIGTIALSNRASWESTRTLTALAGSQIVLTLAANAQSDRISVNWTGAVTFNGSVILEPQEEFEIGRQWTIMTVNNVAFTFEPSYVTPGFNLTVLGNATAGWSVVATKSRDVSEVPDISTMPVTKIGDTFTTLNFDALGVEPDTATVRAYISETADRGETTLGWDRVVEYPAAVATAGRRSFVVDGFEVDSTYYVRHSISNSAGEFVSLDSASFTTRPWETPEVFRLNVDAGNWYDEDSWTHDSPYARSIPEFVGDEAQIYVGTTPVSKTVTLTNDVLVSKLTINEGNNGGAAVTLKADNGSATLTLDAAADDNTLISIGGQLQHVYFGVTGEDEALTLNFAKPAEIRNNSAYNHYVHFYATLVGGSESSPSDLMFKSLGDQYAHMRPTLYNTNNTFRGDICLGDSVARSGTTVMTVGNAAVYPFDDAMLGDPANKIRLGSNSTIIFTHASGEDALLKRTVLGNGTVQTTNLRLDKTAVIAPCGISGTGYGTINMGTSGNRITSFSDASATTYSFKIADEPGTADKLTFDVSGDLSIAGKIEILPESKNTPIGESWEIMTIANNTNTALSYTFTSAPHPFNASKYFKFTVEENENKNGWIVKANCTSRTLILVR